MLWNMCSQSCYLMSFFDCLFNNCSSWQPGGLVVIQTVQELITNHLHGFPETLLVIKCKTISLQSKLLGSLCNTMHLFKSHRHKQAEIKGAEKVFFWHQIKEHFVLLIAQCGTWRKDNIMHFKYYHYILWWL